jgi:autotransporter-associated beta strand protein
VYGIRVWLTRGPLLLALSAWTTDSYAQLAIWSGAGADNLWSNPANWDVVPSSSPTQNLEFGNSLRLSPVVDLNNPWVLGAITFNATAGPYSFSGNALTLHGGIVNNDADTQTFANTITLGASQTWDAQAGNLVFNGASQLAGFALTLSGPFAFDLNGAVSGTGSSVTLRDNATVRMTAANTYTGTTTVSGGNSGAVLEFNSAAQFAGGGGITINQNGILRLLDQGGSTVTLANEFTWNGDRFASAISPVIDVAGATDTLVITNDINMTGRQGIVKAGQGTLRYAPAALPSDTRWSLGIREGTVEMNQLPYRSGQNNNQGQPTGDLDFLGNSTLRILFDSGIAASLPAMTGNIGLYGYGFSQIRVADNVTATIQVDSGALFKITGRTDTNNRMLGTNSTLVLDGTDLTSRFLFGVGNSGGTINETPTNRTLDLRGGTLAFFGVNKTFWPQTSDFTLKLNGGEYDGRQLPGLQALTGNLIINDNPSASTPRIRALQVTDTGSITLLPSTNPSYGNILWNGTLAKVGNPGDTLLFNRNASGSGTGGFVFLNTGAALDLQGGTVTVGGQIDPFTDSFNNRRHVNLATATGTTLNANRDIALGTLSGSGTLTTSTAGTKTITLDSAASSSFGGAITNGSGTVNLLKRGTANQTFTSALATGGTLTLDEGGLTLANNGTLLGTSGLILNSGTFRLDNTATNSANRLSDTAPVLFNGGTFQILGNALAATTETTGPVTVATGTSTLRLTPSGAQPLTLTLSGLTRTGGALDFTADSGTLGGGGTNPAVFITGAAAGLLGGWATVGDSFAEYTLANGVRAFTASDFNYDSNTATLRHLDITATQTLTANEAELTARYTGAFDTDLGGFTLNFHDGGLLKTGTTTTTLSNGTLTAGNATPGSSLNITTTDSSTLAVSAAISDNPGGAVSTVKSGSGTLDLRGGVHTFSGGLTLAGGTTRINADSQLGTTTAANTVTLAGGTLLFDEAGSNAITVDADRTFTLAAGTASSLQLGAGEDLIFGHAGALTGGPTASLRQSGGPTGEVIISAANTGFSATWTLDAGILTLQHADSLGGAGAKAAIALNAGTLRLDNAANTTFGNNVALAGTATITVAGGGAHTLGSIDLNTATLFVSGTGGSSLTTGDFALSQATNLNNAAATTIAGNLTGSYAITKTGIGNLTLSGSAANTYTGAFTVNTGTLLLAKSPETTAITGPLLIGDGTGTDTVRLAASHQIADTSALTINSSGVLDLDGFNERVGSLTGSGSVLLGSGTLTTGDAASTSFSGVLSGTGSLVKEGQGTFTLSGANTYTGPTTVNAGTLSLTGGAGRLDAATRMTVATGATLALNGNHQQVSGLAGGGTVSLGSATLTIEGADPADNASFSGSITGTGGLTKSGTSTQTLTGINSYTGDTLVHGGTLLIGANNSLSSVSNLRLGDGAPATAAATFATGGYSQVLNSLTLNENSILDMGNLSSILRFSNGGIGDFNGHTLTVTNWTGVIATTGGTDQIIFDSGFGLPVNSTTSQVRFVIGPDTYDGLILARPDLGVGIIEVVPVPEPGVWATAALLAAWALFQARRRRFPRPAPTLSA